MPSKLDDASNLRFLHACLRFSDYSRIDYAKVAAQFSIQAPAARMRFARLNNSLGAKSKGRKRNDEEDGPPRKKRKQKDGVEYGAPKEDDDDEEMPIGKTEPRDDGNVPMGDVRIKQEDEDEEENVPLRVQRYGCASAPVWRASPVVAGPSHGLPRIGSLTHTQPPFQQQPYYFGALPPMHPRPEPELHQQAQADQGIERRIE